MRILLTNDDGFDTEGIRHLVEWAKSKGEVCVCAPKQQQSGKSHSIEIHNSYEVKRVNIFDGVEAYSVASTPADCVRVAILGMKKKFDLVISGINCGHNVGGDIEYSGTVGAAFEGAKCGVKAMALSACFESFDNAIKNLDRVYDEIQRRKMFDHANILNVNFPQVGDKILITKTGPAIYSDDFEFLENDMVAPHLICLYKGTQDVAFDTDAVMTGNISITPISINLTDESALNAIMRKK